MWLSRRFSLRIAPRTLRANQSTFISLFQMQNIKLHSARISSVDLKTRMPFKYGIATMTAFPLVFVTLDCEINGQQATGISSDLLPPKWFKKDPDQTPDAELRELRDIIEHACNISCGIKGKTVFECWQQIYNEQDAWGHSQSHPPLLTHFGSSLVERALIDGFCRHSQMTFFHALKANALGLHLDAIHPGLNDSSLITALPKAPLKSIISRHTVGLSDPLTASDIDPNDRLQDGLPQSLDACMNVYGIRHLKIKICGDFATDRQRLLDISQIVSQGTANRFAFTLDGNEQFESIEQFRDFWNRLITTKELQSFMKHLLFTEQPIKRDVALDQTVSSELHAWNDKPRIIIDESDGTLTNAADAIRMGYAGTSHKNCKGVIKSIANRALFHSLSRSNPTAPCIMSGEDLCNQGPVAVMQDLCVTATLGIESVERNGHHYCAGLSSHPENVREQMLRHHGDVYHPSPQGWPTLRIEDGLISTRTINQAPFGIKSIPDIANYSQS